MVPLTGQGTINFFGMKPLLPEIDGALAGQGRVTKQLFQTLRPGKGARFYIPIPNCIVCSPGNDLKIARVLMRMIFR